MLSATSIVHRVEGPSTPSGSTLLPGLKVPSRTLVATSSMPVRIVSGVGSWILACFPAAAKTNCENETPPAFPCTASCHATTPIDECVWGVYRIEGRQWIHIPELQEIEPLAIHLGCVCVIDPLVFGCFFRHELFGVVILGLILHRIVFLLALDQSRAVRRRGTLLGHVGHFMSDQVAPRTGFRCELMGPKTMSLPLAKALAPNASAAAAASSPVCTRTEFTATGRRDWKR